MSGRQKQGIAEIINGFFDGGLPIRISAYDGSVAGDASSPYGIRILNRRGLSYILTASGDLGLARAYVSGDLELEGTHPGDPYPLLRLIVGNTDFARPSVAELASIVRALGLGSFVPPRPPDHEHLPVWRTAVEGARAAGVRAFRRHTHERDAEAIHHHYDVSNTFYEHVLGPSMAYTCAVFPTEDATLEEAQAEKFDLICRKLDLKPGMRLLDVGCGWGSMVRHAAKHYGVKALGVTLSREQANWAAEAIKADRLDDLAEVRFSDYRHVVERDFDAISSIGMTEHIGVRNYPSYFGFLHGLLKDGGRLLNHTITRNDNTNNGPAGAFIDRFVFPDGELAGSGTVVVTGEDAGFELQHHENFRLHYAKTLAGWNKNLVDNWDACVAETDLGTAKVWGLYIAGSRVGFEHNEIQLHHTLFTKTVGGVSGYPLRHTF